MKIGKGRKESPDGLGSCSQRITFLKSSILVTALLSHWTIKDYYQLCDNISSHFITLNLIFFLMYFARTNIILARFKDTMDRLLLLNGGRDYHNLFLFQTPAIVQLLISPLSSTFSSVQTFVSE